MTLDPQAVDILKNALMQARQRDEAARPLAGGRSNILREIEMTVLPRHLEFSDGENKLEMIAGSGRLLRMIAPTLTSGAERNAQIAEFAGIVSGFAEASSITVVSTHLEDDIAAEEVGFPVSEIDAMFDSTAAVAPTEDDPIGEGARGYYQALEALPAGQAFLLANGEEIEISGEDILPEDDAQVAPLLADIARIKQAVTELCGADAVMLRQGANGTFALAFSEEGEVVSLLSETSPDDVAGTWAKCNAKVGG